LVAVALNVLGDGLDGRGLVLVGLAVGGSAWSSNIWRLDGVGDYQALFCIPVVSSNLRLTLAGRAGIGKDNGNSVDIY
jgi:hypothetical protein